MTMCYYPWVGLDITPQGEYKPCCKYENIVANSLEEYLASEEIANLKQNFLDGKRPSACRRCWKDEDAGILSKRQMDAQTDLSCIETESYKTISLTFGNTCNLVGIKAVP